MKLDGKLVQSCGSMLMEVMKYTNEHDIQSGRV